MKHKAVVFTLLIGWLVIVGLASPLPPPALIPACFDAECDSNSGPVCGIDDSGLPRTFQNRCMADLAFCQYGTYFAELKPGEC